MKLINYCSNQLRKITIFTIFLFLLTVQLVAQNQNVTLSGKQLTIHQAFAEIEKQTNHTVAYNEAIIDVNKNIAEEVIGKTLPEALESVLKNTNTTFRIQGKQILIIAKQTQTADKQYKGVVVDKLGDAVIGASVTIKGQTNIGTITNIDGEYTLTAPVGSTLVISYVGFLPYEIKTTENNTLLDIVLEEDSEVLDEVVVTALGIKRSQKALSYNVQELKQDDFLKVKDVNFINSINGKIAGVTINKSSTGVGGASRVVIRGAKSIEGDNNVLYVVDGIPLFNTNMGSTDSGILGEGRAGSEGIADFNPEDIESMSVLSGPAAAALYGSMAANGVILVTTKKGEEGKLQVTFSSTSEFSKPLMVPEFQNTYANKKDTYESWGEKMASPSSYNPKDDFFNTGTTFINAVTLTTGSKTNQTFVSLAATNADGIVPNNSYDRFNASMRNTSRFLNDKLQLDLGASYVKQKDQNMVSQGLYWNPIVAAYLFPRGESFEAMKTFETYDSTRKFATQNWPISENTYAPQNPYWTAYRNPQKTTKNRFMFHGVLTYNILDWLNVSGRYRIDHTYADIERKIYASSNEKFAAKKGNYEHTNFKATQEYADFMVNINKHMGDFNIASHVGFSYYNTIANELQHKGNLIGVTNDFTLINIDPRALTIIKKGGDQSIKNLALFASVELGWKGMLYLTLTGRNEWNSRLVNSKESSFFYPSIGLSGVISEMVKLPEVISYLKVRGSYTDVGAPIAKSGLTPGTITTPVIGGVIKETGIFPFIDFKAEKTSSYEFGWDLRMFKNKISLNGTWYKSNTKNQTFIGNLPESSGYESAYLQAGNVENKGWEITLGYQDKLGDFNVSSSLAFSKNTNVIKEMVENYKHPLSLEPMNIPQVAKDNYRTILKVGGSINDLYASQFLKKDSQGYVEIKEDGSYGLEQGEPVYLGRSTPDFTLGWNNSVSYKGIGLSFLINARVGGVVTSSTQAILDRFGVSKASGIARDQGGVMIPNQGLVDAQKYYGIVATGEPGTAGYYTYSATNVRLQELALSYSLPTHWFNDVFSELTVSFIANNLWMIYCKAPHDPELTASTSTYGQGNDYFMQPSLRSFGFGIKVKF